METILKERKFNVIGYTKQERMGVREGIRSFFPEDLANEMGFEGMMGKHTDFQYSYTYR